MVFAYDTLGMSKKCFVCVCVLNIEIDCKKEFTKIVNEFLM